MRLFDHLNYLELCRNSRLSPCDAEMERIRRIRSMEPRWIFDSPNLGFLRPFVFLFELAVYK